LPAVAFAAILCTLKVLKDRAAYIAVGATGLSFAMSVWVLAQTMGGTVTEYWTTWFTAGTFKVPVGILIDPLAGIMLVVVTSVSLLVQIYSLGYMKGDRRFAWYYAALSLFTASMLSLVLANNFLQMYMSWELVGLCSYLLIGFWYEKKSASNAAIKAFVTTRLGDVGFFIGLGVLFVTAGTFGFTPLKEMVETHQLSAGVLTAVSLLFFMGAAGKSAQFPLHVWLPDAMEGPTPVSALIHAATMVAAGVYLVARSFFMFEAAGPAALTVVTVIGTVTAFMAALIAITQTDIKKVLAYSTISQLGYMMAALGVGGYAAGTFHLTTHAFFKALLFLGAGSVIHGAGTQNINEMGGLWKKMKVTGWTFLIATMSLAGIAPLSGFWSKDEILADALGSGHFVIFALLLATAFLTAFYMFKLFFTVFTGELKDKHAHESPAVMTWPLIILAVPAAVLGLAGSPLFGNAWARFVSLPGEHIAAPNFAVMLISTVAALLGIYLAYVMYYKKSFAGFSILNSLTSFNWANTVGVDNLIKRGIDFTLRMAARMGRFDADVIDGAVNGIADSVSEASGAARKINTGALQGYAMRMIIGFVLIAIAVYLVLVRG
jgi:NADH-quinone oxidoreductase subunit L